ncbi:MAG: DUF4838 domain-containing protein [Clostridia bacterium]|nr:DUF4838 domain-containing protein [Clostridia bacterium]
MYTIHKITSHPVVDFAAEELKEYLRMMMPEAGDIAISYAPEATDGYRLGLMTDFGLNTDEADDLALDDIIHIDTTDRGGIIAGSNPRSVLLAVYRFLRENGCRWLYPGVDGEYIPIKTVEGVQYHKLADCRYRGECNEGAEYQQSMLEAIDFAPKIGLNVFMLEFDNPKGYYDWYYDHRQNQAQREPEPISAEQTLQWKRQCETEMAKRGLQFHDMGHGWTAESFGIVSGGTWDKDEANPIPEGVEQYIAMIDGERKLYKGVALNTNFCMSNPDARALVVKRVVSYAKNHQNVDYLHIWLADAHNNHCECKSCQKKITSDWYIMLMNEIDAALTAEGMDTRIVYICYYDTIYPAETEKLNNPERFSMLFAPITRSYVTPVAEKIEPIELKKYQRNNIERPRNINEFISYGKEWLNRQNTNSMVYEYHFWVKQYYEPGGIAFAKVVHDDVKGYRANGFGGIIEDGSQRSFFPNGFPFYVYGQTLFDTSINFEELKEDYFSHAYGDDWREVVEFLEGLGKLFGHAFLDGSMSADPSIGNFYNPPHAQSLRKIPAYVDAFEPFVKAHRCMPTRAQTISMRLLNRYLEYCKRLSEVCAVKCFGATDEAERLYQRFVADFGKYELEMQQYYDHFMAMQAHKRTFVRERESIPGLE